MDASTVPSPPQAAVARARDLAEEYGMHVVCLSLRGPVEGSVSAALLVEAEADVTALLAAEDHPLWLVEREPRWVLLVVDGLAQDLKASLVGLEEEHWLGPWLNLDLVTVLEDGRAGPWHASPMRPTPRATPDAADLAARLPQGLATG